MNTIKVKNIGREYRGTGRSTPTKPSQYVSMIFTPLQDYKITRDQITTIIKNVTVKYTNQVVESINTNRGIEASLKRMRKVKREGETDDDKIRSQLLLDVEFYLKNLSEDVGEFEEGAALKRVVLDELERRDD